ncbi:MAG: helix-turn-helix domain-containing protein [Paracoccaceae bacterium]
MKPFLEALPWRAGSSIALLNRRLEHSIPFQWHHHPEFELTLTLNSRGQRFIGDHVGDYDDGDLVLVGPNLPHTWASRTAVSQGQHVALVIWFHPDWVAKIVDDFVEFAAVGRLLARAGRGLVFSKSASDELRQEFAGFFTLPAMDQMLSLAKMLNRLERDSSQILASAPAHHSGVNQSRERIDRVLSHIHSHYHRAMFMAELADIAALSLSGLRRLFGKHTQGTVTQYVAALRIGDASARLAGTDQPVAHISDAVGFRALANFNRQFKAAKGVTPREYRAQFGG